MSNEGRSGPKRFKGNLLFFYSFDIGDDIEFTAIRKKGLLVERLVPLSPYFKNYNIPFSFSLPAFDEQGDKRDSNVNCLMSKVHRFGVVTFCYQVPFESSLEELKTELIRLHHDYNRISDEDARLVFDRIYSAIGKPYFYHLKNSYFMINVIPDVDDPLSPEEFRRRYGETLASLIRLERETLSRYQVNDILSSTTGYSGEDCLIIDNEGALLYDDEYYEVLEFFSYANVQELELQYFDRMLDKRLEAFYLKPYQVPWLAYIPIIGGRLDFPVLQLSRLRVDISVIVERLEGSISRAGDAYYSRVYEILQQRLSIDDWKESINKKLDIISDLYNIHQHHIESFHFEVLELIIIVLIAIEILMPFIKR